METDAERAEPRSDIEVGGRRFELAGGVVVDNNIPIAADLQQRRHRAAVAAGQYLDRDQAPLGSYNFV